MFFPVKDDNPCKRQPLIIFILMVINTAVFMFQFAMGPQSNSDFIRAWGSMPAELSRALAGEGSWMSVFVRLNSSMFMHASILHLLGNMWFLWIFGDNIEDRMGRAWFPVFYWVCGIAAGVADSVARSGSHVPAIGASGAISGLMGAYLVLFPRARITVYIVLRYISIGKARVWSAAKLMAWWLVFQVALGLFTWGARGGVAWWAHIGGFAAGASLALIDVGIRGWPTLEAPHIYQTPRFRRKTAK